MDANVCVRKYLSAASLDCWLDFCKIKGINDRRFSSSPTHAEIQLVDEMEIAVPEIRVK